MKKQHRFIIIYSEQNILTNIK